MLGKLYTMVWCSVFFSPGRSEGAVLCGWTAGGSGRMQGQSGAALCGAELQWSLSKRLMGSLKHVNVVLLNGLPWVHTAEFWASLHPSQCLIDHLSKVRIHKPYLHPSQCLIDHLSKVRLHKPLSAPIPVPHRPPQQGRLHKPLSAPIPVPHRPPQQGETSQTFICTHPSAS